MKRQPLQHQYLTISKTGVRGYRRRVPEALRDYIRQSEITRSLRTADPALVPLHYAKVHSEVERLFKEARDKSGISDDLAFDLGLQTLRARGLEDVQTTQDRSDAADIILTDAGYQDADELSDELEAHPNGKAPLRLRTVAAAMAILAGGKRKPILSFCLRQFLTDKARGRDTTRGIGETTNRNARR